MSYASRIEAKIEALKGEVMIETNQGTYGAEEARRKVGCGDPAFADYFRFESLDGTIRESGCKRDDAPGRIRKINERAIARRREIAKLEDALGLAKEIGPNSRVPQEVLDAAK